MVCCTKAIQSECYQELAEKKKALEEAKDVESFNASANRVYEFILIGVCAIAGLIGLCCIIVLCHLRRRGVYIKKVHKPTFQPAAEVTVTD